MTKSKTNIARVAVQTLCIACCVSGASIAVAGMIIPIRASVAQIMFSHAFDQNLKQAALKKTPKYTNWTDMTPVGRIAVPHLGISKIVLDTGSRQAMSVGPTLLPGTAAIGAQGTSVIAAHRDTHFRFLKDVKVGDAIVATDRDGVARNYRITRTEIVAWDDFVIEQSQSQNELALSTCYPFESTEQGPLRYVVHAVEQRDKAT